MEKMVAREGVAPPTSLCKRDMILFHHRAFQMQSSELRVQSDLNRILTLIGYRGWTCTNTRAFKGRCPAIKRRGKEMVARQGNAPCSAD